MTLLQKAHDLPEVPGVYRMYDKKEQILYVGKAKNLKARVTSYFLPSTPHTVKIKQMIAQIAYFKIIEVPSEFDALLLECALIHHYRPPYNKLMNHYEDYHYFQLTKDGALKVMPSWSDQGQTFGPFFKKAKMMELLAVINSVYRLTGPLKFANGIVEPYSPNTTKTEKEDEYQLRLAEIAGMLTGANQKILTRIDDKVAFYAEVAQFEQADVWWQKREIVARFLKRNQRLLEASQHHYFLGILPLAKATRYYLYFQGEVVADTTYKKSVPVQQAVNKLKKKFTQADQKRLEQKAVLTQADADLFPIFFNYLNRFGEIITLPQKKD